MRIAFVCSILLLLLLLLSLLLTRFPPAVCSMMYQGAANKRWGSGVIQFSVVQSLFVLPLLLLFLLLLVLFPVHSSATTTAMTSTSLLSFPSNPSMFEISTRPWLYELSQKYQRELTKLSDIPDAELEQLAARGIQVVWFMGVWHLGEYGLNFDRTNPQLLQSYSQVLPGYTQADIIGSPYAITNYTLNPELGTLDDLVQLRQRLNKLGMLLMLDFVPNHSAVDSPLTSSNPTDYVRAPQGTQPPYDTNRYLPSGIAYGWAGWGASWMDTAQFNYWDEHTIAERINDLLTVAKYADAIRCDMAFLCLNDQIQQIWGQDLASWGYTRPSDEFWSTAISKIKGAYPNVKFLAEVYNPWQQTLQDLGFDFTYDKTLYDHLADGNLDNLRGYISSLSSSYLHQSAHFVSNHDEERATAEFGSWWRADAAALVSLTLPGMRFYWQGQWEGYKYKLDVHLRRERSEPVVPDVEVLYNNLTHILSDDVFHLGQWEYLDLGTSGTAWRLMAWKWTYQNEKRLCVLNYSDTEGSASIVLPDAQPVAGNDTIPVQDLLTGTVYYRSAQQMQTQGLFVVVNQWFAQIFKYN